MWPGIVLMSLKSVVEIEASKTSGSNRPQQLPAENFKDLLVENPVPNRISAHIEIYGNR